MSVAKGLSAFSKDQTANCEDKGFFIIWLIPSIMFPISFAKLSVASGSAPKGQKLGFE